MVSENFISSEASLPDLATSYRLSYVGTQPRCLFVCPNILLRTPIELGYNPP